jgi:tetratricopeptide (TPR) repeat protein
MIAASASRRLPVAPLLVFALAATAAVGLSREAARWTPRGRALEEMAYYPSGRWLVPASLGERATMADLTWLRAVQYYGEHRVSDNRFGLLYHVFDIVTSLDPRHRNSYVFGGTSLAQEGAQFERGIALLEKARAADPSVWTYPFEIGFLYFVERRDYATASLWFREATRKADCPDYVERFAAFTAGRAGYRDQAVELWQRVAETTTNHVLREKAVEQARKLAQGTGRMRSVERWVALLEGRPDGNPR